MTPGRRYALVLVASVALVALGGCPAAHDALDAGPDVGSNVGADVGTDAGPPVGEGLDLLFVIDNSGHIHDEARMLADTLPRMLEVLATGDLGLDGTTDFQPVASLHVGVVTTDLGAGPNDGVPTCARGLGDDGILRARSRFTSAPCQAEYPSGVFAFAGSAEERESFGADLACVVDAGEGGCGFKQQLEAALKALTPSRPTAWTRAGYEPPRFVSAEGALDALPGHGDGANAGFLRERSALAILLLTYRDDCSLRDHGLIVTRDPRFESVPLNLRCHTFAAPELGLVHPVERYIDGFLGLRADPRLLVFAGIVGLPDELEPAPAAPIDFERILAHPLMEETVSAMGTSIEPSCASGYVSGYPPRRIVRVAEGLAESGAHVSLSSICPGVLESAMDRFLASVAEVFPIR